MERTRNNSGCDARGAKKTQGDKNKNAGADIHNRGACSRGGYNFQVAKGIDRHT